MVLLLQEEQRVFPIFLLRIMISRFLMPEKFVENQFLRHGIYLKKSMVKKAFPLYSAALPGKRWLNMPLSPVIFTMRLEELEWVLFSEAKIFVRLL